MIDEKAVTLKFHEKKTGRLTGPVKYLSRTAKLRDQIFMPSQRRIMIFVSGMIERVNFANTPTIILGRYDETRNTPHLLDLRSYGALERGVSRSHCRLELKDNQLIVTDLNSSNGTYVSGKRLMPNQPYVLKKGEDLLLGRLPIQIVAEASG